MRGASGRTSQFDVTGAKGGSVGARVVVMVVVVG